MDYWKECISEAFEDASISATDDQIATVAYWAEGAHESFRQVHGHDCIPNPLWAENEQLTRELQAERDKQICRECNGSGSLFCYGPVHRSQSRCDKCNGEGRH